VQPANGLGPETTVNDATEKLLALTPCVIVSVSSAAIRSSRFILGSPINGKRIDHGVKATREMPMQLSKRVKTLACFEKQVSLVWLVTSLV
jgi:hypothetical protein